MCRKSSTDIIGVRFTGTFGTIYRPTYWCGLRAISNVGSSNIRKVTHKITESFAKFKPVQSLRAKTNFVSMLD
jgi:hypothetical protein